MRLVIGIDAGKYQSGIVYFDADDALLVYTGVLPNDYIEHGADAQYINFGEESPNPRAVQSLDIYTKQDKNGEGLTTISKIKLNDAVRAINELNKMDGSHAPDKHQQVGEISVNFEGGEV